MNYNVRMISEDEVRSIYSIKEDHFNDFKAKDINGKKLSKAISAFANADGGEIYIGIREERDTKIKHWEGYADSEEANGHVQVIESLDSLGNHFAIEYLQHPTLNTLVMQLSVFKSAKIVKTTDDKIFVRRGAQCIPVDTIEMYQRLELDKGIVSFEDELVTESEVDDIIKSKAIREFSTNMIPNADCVEWLKKQRLLKNEKVTVAGEMLFSDEPQIVLPKRSAIKIFRYATSGEADRDMLTDQPITIEGNAYHQAYEAVTAVKNIIEKIKKLGKGLENIEYPEETLHEIITNAVLHRDYSVATDIQIRIFDNRVEVESPGRLPGHITVDNILSSQFARNPKLVRLINKFPDAPNKDVGEGLNTAFDAMTKLRLKTPTISETENSVIVVIKHERLASPEKIVIDYMAEHDTIRNSEGRSITGIKSENTMKNVFYKLRDQGYIKLVPGYNYWEKTDQFAELNH